MLVLSRRIGERVRIGDGIELAIVATTGDTVHLEVVAPRDTKIVKRDPTTFAAIPQLLDRIKTLSSRKGGNDV